jgi:5'/3'-nucleotidase SurE
VYECDGTPAGCVRAGLLGGLATGADLVVSGINHGANVADGVVYSGTERRAGLWRRSQYRPDPVPREPPQPGW